MEKVAQTNARVDSRISKRTPIRILTVDDLPVVLSGIRACLAAEQHIEIVGQALDDVAAIREARRLMPDVILMDLIFSGMDGIGAMTRIRSGAPRAKIIAYTTFKGEKLIQRTMEVGARGYVLKTSGLSVLVRAIKSVHQGNTFLDPNIHKSRRSAARGGNAAPENRLGHASAVYAPVLTPSPQPAERNVELTPQQKRILRFLCDGLTLKEIGGQLGVTYYTMTSHIKQIYSRLEVHTRGQAVAQALKYQRF